MDAELLELISRLADTTNPLTDEELARVEEAITGIAGAIDRTKPTDDDIAVLSEAKEQLDRVRAVQAERTAAAEERAAKAAELLESIAVPEPVAEAAPVEEAEVAEVEAVEVVVEAEQVVADAPVEQPVAAAAVEQYRLPSISQLARRRPPERRPVATATERPSSTVLRASGGLDGRQAGNEVDRHEWAGSLMQKWEAIRHSSPGRGEEKIYMGKITRDWPEERTLSRDSETENDIKINAVVDPARFVRPPTGALVASGGICSPVAVDYNLTTIAQAGRPVRDGLAQFGATRGGIRFVLPHTLASVTTDAPAGLWTEANDVSLNSPSTKVKARFVCQGVQETLVDAVTSQVEFGVFQSRYFPEQIDQYMATADAVHARLGEATLLHDINAGSTQINAGNYAVGGARELLSIIDRSAAAARYQHRMAPESPLRVIYPEWLEDLVREDLAKNLPGDSGGHSERLAVTDAEIDGWFAVRNINVTNAQDSPTGASVLQGWNTQQAGDLQAWPLKTIIWMFPEGSWMFLDGGSLDLGLIRDSTTVSTNDFIMFSETFEKAVFRGHFSWAITCSIWPSGSSIGTESPAAVTETLGS